MFLSLTPNMAKFEPPDGTLAGTQVPASAEEPAASRLTAATVVIKEFRIGLSSRELVANAIILPVPTVNSCEEMVRGAPPAPPGPAFDGSLTASERKTPTPFGVGAL